MTQQQIINFLRSRPLISVNGLSKLTGVSVLRHVMAGTKYYKLSEEQCKKLVVELEKYGYGVDKDK